MGEIHTVTLPSHTYKRVDAVIATQNIRHAKVRGDHS
jgi:hypothetical protein